jgi:hypothetical protein
MVWTHTSEGTKLRELYDTGEMRLSDNIEVTSCVAAF